MRSVLAILGIAVVALVISIVFQGSKDLSPAPQDEAALKLDEAQKAAWKKSEAEQKKAQQNAKRDFQPPREGVTHVTLEVGGKGRITLELYPKAAPETVQHFMNLIREGFYKNIKFHRVEPVFVVQAGDPDTRDVSSSELAGMDEDRKSAMGIGSGGSGKNIPFEVNKLPHIKGSIAMALSAPRSATGDSQFFINLRDNMGLNGDYCVFGRVTKGMDVVEKIAVGDAIVGASVE
ncbi:MAG: peptidylprolyl isomerase [Chthonomonadales bacterium]|nr:peptidylprolyl isomerase [Chthonomonadales bacterium]